MRKYCTLFVLFFIAFNVASQNFTRPGEWKKYRKEVFVLGGTCNFLGDLGGLDKTGTDYSPVDLDFPVTKSTWGLGYRYKVQRWFNLTAEFQYLMLKGDDALTQDIYRNNRNLNFKSNIFELAGRIEIGWQSSKAGNRYGIKRTLSRRMKNNNHNVFLFAGVGGFYFNPKGRTAKGDYVKLKPLHTEGQGLPGGPKQYSNFSVCIPLGIYYKAVINKQWSVGVELSWRKTFTNYIDDVGISYYDSTALVNAYGPLAEAMADPSLGILSGASKPSADGTAAQRGDNEYDSYVSLQITFGYVFKQKRKRARLRSKF